jgi:predicted DNA binding CopG/RHH family protein
MLKITLFELLARAIGEKERNVRVTITLSEESVEFFKAEAEKGGSQYQTMILRLLDEYVSIHKMAS